MKRPSGQRERDRRKRARPLDLQREARSRLPAERLHRFLQSPSLRAAAIDLDDAISGLDACPLRGTSRGRRDYYDPSVPHVDLYADTGIVSGRRFVKAPELVGGEQRRVGVLELVEHSVDRHAVHHGGRERVDVVAIHVREHVIEESGGFGFRSDWSRSCSALQEPAARDKRHQQERADSESSGAKSGSQVQHQARPVPNVIANRSGKFRASAALTRSNTSPGVPCPSTRTIGPHSGCVRCQSSLAKSAKADPTREKKSSPERSILSCPPRADARASPSDGGRSTISVRSGVSPPVASALAERTASSGSPRP